MNEVVSNAGAKTSEFRLVLLFVLFVLVVLLDGTPWVAVPEACVTILAGLLILGGCESITPIEGLTLVDQAVESSARQATTLLQSEQIKVRDACKIEWHPANSVTTPKPLNSVAVRVAAEVVTDFRLYHGERQHRRGNTPAHWREEVTAKTGPISGPA